MRAGIQSFSTGHGTSRSGVMAKRCVKCMEGMKARWPLEDMLGADLLAAADLPMTAHKVRVRAKAKGGAS